MRQTVHKIFSLFSKSEKIQCYLLFFGMVIRGVIEVAGVASIMPFIAVVSNQNIIHSNSYLLSVYTFLGCDSAKEFLFILGVVVFGIILLNNSLAALTDWYLFRFTWLRSFSLSQRLFAKYLSKDYSFYLSINSSELGANILTEVSHYMKGILRPFMEMAARLVVCVFLFILLVSVDPLLALIVGITLGSAYTGIFLFVRKKLGKIGEERLYHNRRQFLYINEALSGIKDLKVKGCEQFFLDSFSSHAYKVNMHQATQQIVSQFPRYALESIAFGGILLIILYFVMSGQNTEQMIPLLALYAFAGYRLMPSLQSVFVGITTVKFNLPLLDKLYTELKVTDEHQEHITFSDVDIEKLPIGDGIILRDIRYSYPDSDDYVLDGINLDIKTNSTIGLVGTTGAGKTTLVDIMLGLLEPQSGQLLIGGKQVEREQQRNLRANIGYVPQQIFLSDQTVMQNIALGVSDDKISMENVIAAAKVANLHDFITNDLSDGYKTRIGEKGVRLSGGQRQRIGIARALYHDPALLILDEATSALDNITEKNFMSALNNVGNQKTIIMIAHRLTTLEDCDVIHFIDKGRIVASGNYIALQKSCAGFRELVEVNKNEKTL